MRRRRQEIGIRRKRGGWQAFVRIRGKIHSKQFDINTPPGEMRAWRERELAEHGSGLEPFAIHDQPGGTFEGDIACYLHKPEVAAMPSFRFRAAHLARWLTELGRDRRRASITRDEIETVLQRWLASGLSPVTVYHRRTALQSLFVALDGREAANPVRGATRPDHYRPVDRSVPFHTLAAIIEAMPAVKYISSGIAQPALAKLRAAVMLHTGIPPAELKKLKRHDFDRDAQIVRMPWRNKGAGTPAHVRELSAEGVAAFIALDAAHGWGSFPTEALGHSFKRAARTVCGADTTIRLYDLRHSFGTDLYRKTRDIETVARLLGHAPGSPITTRYAMGAHADVDRAALEAVTAARQMAVVSELKLPAKLPARRKSSKRKTLEAVS